MNHVHLFLNVLSANSLWSTDSWWIAFRCLPNFCRTAECCLPHLGNTSTSNVRIVFACYIRILFAIRCKPGLMNKDPRQAISYCAISLFWKKLENFLKSYKNFEKFSTRLFWKKFKLLKIDLEKSRKTFRRTRSPSHHTSIL